MTIEKKFYVVMLPNENFENIKWHKSLELTVSSSPCGATSNVIARNFEGEKDLKNISIGKAIQQLKNSYQDIGKFAYEIPVEIFDEWNESISSNDPNYKMSMIGFFAQELARRKKLRAIECFGVAEKSIQFYMENTANQKSY